MSSNPYGPNEPASVVLSEETWFQGSELSSMAYGSLLVLFIQCFSLLLKQTKRSNYRTKVPFLIIVLLIFVFGTFFQGSNMKFNQLAFIEDRNFPGGPSAYENDMFAIPVNSLGNVSSVLNQWLCDSLIIWRYMMIFKGCSAPTWIVMFVPVLLFLGSFVLSILFLLQESASSPFVSSGLNWTIPYFATSLAINILVSIAIVSRLLVFRRRIASVLGPNHGTQYTGIAAMIIESAALFSIFSILTLVPFALNNPVSVSFIEPLGLVQGCATLLIILRAASGKAWSADTQQTLISKPFGSAAHGTLGSIQMNRLGPDTTVSSRTNGSFADPRYKSASTILAVNGVTIVKDIETDADGRSLDGESLGDSRPGKAVNAFESV